MRKQFLLFSVLLSLSSAAQLFTRKNINLISYIDPSSSTSTTQVGNRYSGCWGWYQAAKNKEYAISGSSDGTYFIDITNPATPSVSAFVEGRHGCTWREMKTYQHYCYIVSDDAIPNKFQIVDMQYLPDSVHVVHSSNQILERGHTIWIDKDKMYIGMATFPVPLPWSPMAIFSLATPSVPSLIKRVDADIPDAIIHEVHDMFARNDTIYCSAGWKGLVFLKHDVANDTLTILGTYKDYPNAGYNHSSSMTSNGKYLMFCDEVPSSLPIHFLDIHNLSNAQPLVSFFPHLQTTPHNPYIVNNNFAVVSCYQDGIFVYDISAPTNVQLTGYFDTYPQGGDNMNNYGPGAYAGNWGAYPWLPSGVIIANDMKNGVFLLDASKAYTTTTKEPVNPVGLPHSDLAKNNFMVYPNPASSRIAIQYEPGETCTLRLTNILGQVVFQQEFKNGLNDYMDVSGFESGPYVISVSTADRTLQRKLVITK